MAAGSKRKSATSTTSGAKKRKADPVPKTPSKGRGRQSHGSEEEEEPGFALDRAIAMFKKYADPDEKNLIGPEGIERLCEDTGVAADSVDMLLVAYRLGASKMGFFTQQEFLGGMERLGADSPKKLNKVIPSLRSILSDIRTTDFLELYKFTFQFARGEQRVVDIEVAKIFWKMLLESEPSHAALFTQYLEDKKPAKSITRDQWLSFRDFCTAVEADLSNWDDNGAWPLLFDEYVSWRRESS